MSKPVGFRVFMLMAMLSMLSASENIFAASALSCRLLFEAENSALRNDLKLNMTEGDHRTAMELIRRKPDVLMAMIHTGFSADPKIGNQFTSAVEIVMQRVLREGYSGTGLRILKSILSEYPNYFELHSRVINSSLSNSEFNAVPHKVRDGGVRLYNLLYSRLAPDVVKRLNRDIVDTIQSSSASQQLSMNKQLRDYFIGLQELIDTADLWHSSVIINTKDPITLKPVSQPQSVTQAGGGIVADIPRQQGGVTPGWINAIVDEANRLVPPKSWQQLWDGPTELEGGNWDVPLLFPIPKNNRSGPQ